MKRFKYSFLHTSSMEKPIKNLSRRDFLILAGLEAILESFKVGPISLLSRWAWPDSEFRADLSGYPSMPWGEGEVTWDNIRASSAAEMRAKITNPAQALSWVNKIGRYVDDFRDNPRKISSGLPFEDIATQFDYFFGHGSRKSFDNWHEVLKGHGRFMYISEKTRLTYESYEEMISLFKRNNGFKGWFPALCSQIFTSTSDRDPKYPIYVNMVMRDNNKSDKEKLEALFAPTEKRDLFPYVGIWPKEFAIKHPELNLSETFTDYQRFYPRKLSLLPVCEDIALNIADVLIGNSYPALGLYFSGSSWCHIVYLVKCPEGLGYIGWNPTVHFSEPKFHTVKSLVKTDFPQAKKCLVVDLKKHGILDKTIDSGNYDSQAQFVKELIPVDKYPD